MFQGTGFWYHKLMAIKFLEKKAKEPANISRYAGEWVAFVDGKIFAHERNLTRLMERVKKSGLDKKASVLLVPRKDEGPYVLILS